MENKILKNITFVAVFLCFFIIFTFFLFRHNDRVKTNAPVSAPLADNLVAAVAVPVLPPPPPPETYDILIIPGHDVKDGGACYKDICERDLAASIAQRISKILGQDQLYKITIARDDAAWNPVFQDYFQNEKQAIIDWKTGRQAEQKALMASGIIKYVPDMAYHSEVTPETSVKLYGMNKWADESGIDLVLNLHFNDSGRPQMNYPGQFKGFTIFIPESQMKNHVASKAAAEKIFEQLKIVQSPELDNLLEDQSLIALGASGTLGAPSMLIEYAYIYEKKLTTPAEREEALDEYARQTALGIENYFNDSKL